MLKRRKEVWKCLWKVLGRVKSVGGVDQSTLKLFGHAGRMGERRTRKRIIDQRWMGLREAEMGGWECERRERF